MDNISWDELRIFEIVARNGSLSAAARSLGENQPTISRQIKRLEEKMQTPLFRRHIHGIELTEDGKTLLQLASKMHTVYQEHINQISGASIANIRLTCSVYIAHYQIPKFLSELRLSHPEIHIDLVASDGSENLTFRDVDIAIRMYRPTQEEIICKLVGEIELGVFAAKSYIMRKGEPRKAEDLLENDLIGYDKNPLILEGMAQGGLTVSRDDFVARTDSQSAYWELVRAGVGIGFGQVKVGEADPELTRILPKLQLPKLPVWLAASDALRYSKYQRTVWDHLEKFIRENLL